MRKKIENLLIVLYKITHISAALNFILDFMLTYFLSLFPN